MALWLQGCQDPAYLLCSLDEHCGLREGLGGVNVCVRGRGRVRSWNALRSCRLPVASGGMRNTSQFSGRLWADSGTQMQDWGSQPRLLVWKTTVTKE